MTAPALRPLVVGLLALGWMGCATALPAAGPVTAQATPAPAEGAPAEGAPAPGGPDACADAADCREALRASSREGAADCGAPRRMDIARRACTLEVAEGCTALGRWETREPARAVEWFARACAGGDGEGCALRALAALRGQGVARDAAAGRAGLQAACERFPGVACGLAVEGLVEESRRDGGEPEWEWMALFAQRGCDARDARSCRWLGDMFSQGQGVARDADEASELFARACEAGDGKACASQGMLLRAEGFWNAPRAEELISRGCDLGSPEACRLAVLETLGAHASGKDEAGRRALFQHACDQGAALGCLALYDELKQEPVAWRPPFQMPGLLKRSCQLGATQACDFLDEVAEKARPLCASGTAAACGVLGVLLSSPPRLREGEGLEGERLLRGACDAGDAASCGALDGLDEDVEGPTCRAR